MNLFIIFLLFNLSFTYVAEEWTPQPMVEKNYSNRTVSQISTVLLISALIFCAFEETRVLTVVIILFVMAFVATATDTTENKTNKDKDEDKLSLDQILNLKYGTENNVVSISDFMKIKRMAFTHGQQEWLRLMMQKMKQSKDSIQWYDTLNQLKAGFDKLDAGIALMLIEQLELKTEEMTFQRIMKYFIDNKIEPRNSKIDKIKSLFIYNRICEPVDCEFTLLEAVVAVISVILICSVLFSRKFKRKLGSNGRAIVALVCVGTIVLVVLEPIRF